MRGVVLTGHGGLDKLEFRDDIPVPQPAARDVLVRVGAAAVNNTDINTRTAWYSKSDAASDDATWSGVPLQLPRIQGIDVCGEIVAVGDRVSSQRIGERVLIEPCVWELAGRKLDVPGFVGSECDGGFADYTVIASQHAYPIDSQLTDAELASFPCSYSTAENMLVRSAVGPGDTVLVTGASGGVGSAAAQLALCRGATVVAVASPEKFARLSDLGVERLVERDDDLLATLGRNSIDVVVDLVAGPMWPGVLDVLRHGGRYAVAGAIGGAIVDLDLRTLYLKDLSFFGCTILDKDVFRNLIRRIESGDIAPLVAEQYSLQTLKDAQQSFMLKDHVGKIVINVRDHD